MGARAKCQRSVLYIKSDSFHTDKLKFDWGLFNAYVALISHKQTVLQMLIHECEKLNQTTIWRAESKRKDFITPNYWFNVLKVHQKQWRAFALKTGPLAAKQLFWGRKSFISSEPQHHEKPLADCACL